MTETTTLRGALIMPYPSALGPADEPLTIEWPEGHVSDHRKTYFLDFRRPATGHANLVSGVGSAEMDRSSG